MSIDSLIKKAALIRLNTLNSLYKSEIGYVGSCMSVVDILVALYYGELFGRSAMHINPQKPRDELTDNLVLSKGQSAPVLYSILADLGFFDKSELDYIGKPGAMLTSRPNVKIPGVSASMLSYGHGLSVGVGLALAAKMDRKPQRTFVVMGDGELQCGQVWEAAMSAFEHKLDNLVLFIDNNKVQGNERVNVDFLQDKFESFGWNVTQVTDGHNFDQILNALARGFNTVRRPVCIWCHTVVGKGLEFAERKPSYQQASLSEGEMSECIPKLKAIYDKSAA